MATDKALIKLLTTPRTAWSLWEIALILEEPPEKARFKVFKWCKRGFLRQIRKGIYVRTDTKYNPLEVANLVFKPSYISFSTALFLWGAITQGCWSVITVASYLSREIVIDNWILKAIKVKDNILYSPEGLILSEECEFGYATIATPERALLDSIYLYKGSVDVQFPKTFNKKRIEKLLKIYFKSSVTRRKYEKLVKESLS